MKMIRRSSMKINRGMIIVGAVGIGAIAYFIGVLWFVENIVKG